MFCITIRFTGDTANEPALVPTDDTMLINLAGTYMGQLSTLLACHQADPGDTAEEWRKDPVYCLYRRNRNSCVDHPEWRNLTFAPVHTNRPVLNIVLAQGGVTLSWLATCQSTRPEYVTNHPPAWQDSPVMPALSDGQFVAQWINAVPRVFFRLRAW